MKDATISELYDLTQTIAAKIFEGKTYPWEVLPLIKDFILELGETLDPAEYEKRGENVWIAKDAVIAPTASINGPCIIGKGAEIRQCAFIRGNAIVGEGAVVGNSTELKMSFSLIKYRFRITTMSATLFLDTKPIWVPVPLLPM